jgi:hypothetical protein
MSSCLSFHTYCFPRTVFLPRIFFRSTTSTSHNTSSHRSASRFSLKIARFLFLKDRINHDISTKTTIVPLSTHAHYSKSESSEDIHELARSFLLSLEPG